MSTQKITGDSAYLSVKVDNFGAIAKVGILVEDEENAEINEKCAAGSEGTQPSKVKTDHPEVASNDAAVTQAAALGDVDARRRQLFQEFEKERQLIIGQLQREETITANYHPFDQLHRGEDLSCLKREHASVDVSIDSRSEELSWPNPRFLTAIEQDLDPLPESSVSYEEVSQEPHCEHLSQSAISAPAGENRLHVNEFSLLSHYLPSARVDRDFSAESELDRLSRQVQVLVHQLAGCRQNLLRAEIEVGVLHEENRELRCLIKDLLAADSSPRSS